MKSLKPKTPNKKLNKKWSAKIIILKHESPIKKQIKHVGLKWKFERQK